MSERMAPAPLLPLTLARGLPPMLAAEAGPAAQAPGPAAQTGRQELVARLIEAHQHYVADQVRVHNQFLELQKRLWKERHA